MYIFHLYSNRTKQHKFDMYGCKIYQKDNCRFVLEFNNRNKKKISINKVKRVELSIIEQ